MTRYKSYIVLDFDGTVVKHRYPAVGGDIGAVPVLERLVRNGHKLLLNTMRGRNSEGVDTLQPAIDWFAARNIPLYGVNENPSQKEWTSSPKVYGHIYIDDAALGSPLKQDVETLPGDFPAPPYVDWGLAAVLLYHHGLLNQQDIIELVEIGTIGSDLVAIK